MDGPESTPEDLPGRNSEIKPTGPGTSGTSSSCRPRKGRAAGKNLSREMTYRLKLVMLFSMRASNRSFPSFILATKMDDAHRFDDVVFAYPKVKGVSSSGRVFRFVQAKHSGLNTSNEYIAAEDLMGDGDFSLRKYFQSYWKITRNKRLMGVKDELRDLVVCTNVGFRYGGRVGELYFREGVFEKVRDEIGGVERDDILDAELLRFGENFSGRRELVAELKSVLIDLPEKFAGSVFQDREFVLERGGDGDSLRSRYQRVLAEEVLDLRAKRFGHFFVGSVWLSSTAEHFRMALKGEYFKSDVNPVVKDDDSFAEFLREKVLKISGIPADLDVECPDRATEKLVDLLQKNREAKLISIDEESKVISSYFDVFPGSVLREKDGVLKFGSEFLNDQPLRGNLDHFRDCLKDRLGRVDMDFAELVGYRFEIGKSSTAASEARSDDTLESGVQEFLKKLVFAVEQPDHSTLDGLILEEIRNQFDSEEAKIVFSRLLKMMRGWVEEKVGRYLSQKDVEKFLDGLKKEITGSFRFDLEDSVYNFTGRNVELEKLSSLLRSGKKGEVKQAVVSQTASVSHLGGIGKSELARKYAQIQGSSYRNIVWIEGESSQSMGRSFSRLAFEGLGIGVKNPDGEEKALEAVVEEVYRKLGGNWTLFVFDGVVERSHLMGYLPKQSENSQISLLFTSRYKNWKGVDLVITLEELAEDEALTFFANSLGCFSISDEWKELSGELKRFPIALQIASACIKETRTTLKELGKDFGVSEYLLSFREADDALGEEGCPEEHWKTTVVALKVTRGSISKEEHGCLALELSDVMSYLSPSELGVEKLGDIFPGREMVQVVRAVEVLERYSVISMRGRKMDVHRLVQAATRSILKVEGKEEGVLRCVLEEAELLDVENALSAWKFVVAHSDLVKEFGKLPLIVIQKLLDKVGHGAAILFAEKAIGVLERHLGSDDQITLATKNALGISFFEEGMYEKARNIHETVYDVNRELKGEFHPDTLATKYLIGRVLIKQGEYEESLKIHTEILEKGKNIFVENDPFILLSKSCMALLLEKLGNEKQAQKYHEEVYKVSDKETGDEHHYTPVARKNIASVILKLGKFEEGFKMLTEICDREKPGSGSDHPHNMATMRNIAAALQQQGKNEEACKCYQKVQEMQRDLLGESHPDTLLTGYSVAALLNILGDFDGALRNSRTILRLQQSVLGKDHPDSLATKINVARALANKKNFEEALLCYEEVYETRRNILGEHHVDTLLTRNSVASVLMELGELEKALKISREVFDNLKISLGCDNKFTMASLLTLASVLQAQGKFREVLKVFEDVYGKQRNSLGEDDLLTIETKNRIALILCELGKDRKALKMLEDTHAKLCRIYGEDSYESLKVKINIACVLSNQGKYELALKTFVEVFDKGKVVLGENHPKVVATKVCIDALMARNMRFRNVFTM